MIGIPTGLAPELVPLAWLIGEWEGDGMVEYEVDGEVRRHPFRQRVEFAAGDRPWLEYRATAWLLPVDDGDAATEHDALGRVQVRADLADGGELEQLSAETGFWRLARPRTDGDVGPGMLPASGDAPMPDADAVETLRNDEGGFDLEVSIAHPTGVVELYLGMIRGPRVDLATDGVLRSGGAADHRASTRMYGLVQQRLFWVWELAALGGGLATHASAQLERVGGGVLEG
ncbi:MAG: FABP family protein [Microbacteriaceae bacterium]|nr:FABP family protein [Microbacteriaceae bacterium]